MARGGARPGAGRPRKGSVAPAKATKAKPSGTVAHERIPKGTSPLEYMLSVMLDSDADPLRRDRMAMAAAPFVHIRAADAKPTEKDVQAEKAKSAGLGKFASAAAPLKLVARK